MKIEYHSLTMENFGPYEGRHSLDFSPQDGGSPVTLVDGKNGFGKTSILHAFHYLLYGEADVQKRYRMINRSALENGQANMKIELGFQRGGQSHQILRSVDAPPGVRGDQIRESLTYIIDGTPQPNPAARIREVLPKPASQFFFFDGAKIARYADLENSQEVRDAIELVLGLPAFENASKHLKRLQDRWEKQARDESQKDAATVQLARDVQHAAEKLEQAEADAVSAKTELNRLHQEQEALKSQLAKFAGYREKLANMEELENKVTIAKDKLQGLRSEQAKVVRRYAQWHLLPLLEKRLDRVSEERAVLDETNRASERRSFADELINNITADPPAPLASSLTALESWINSRYPRATDEIDRGHLAQLTVEVGRLEQKLTMLRNVDAPEDVKTAIREHRTRVAKLETELKEERRGLTQSDVDEARDVAGTHENVLKAIGAEEKRFATLSQDAADLQKEYTQLNEKMAKASTSDKAKKFSLLAGRAAAHRNAFDILLDKARQMKRKSIEDHSTVLFKQLTRKSEVYARFRINDDYTLSLLDGAGREQRRDQISSGEKQLVALSFIVGLMKSTDRVAPLIIDTPFGHLDKTHRAHVAKHLPQVGQQLALLVTDADMMPEYEDELKAVTGKSFQIVYDQKKQSSRLVEVS